MLDRIEGINTDNNFNIRIRTYIRISTCQTDIHVRMLHSSLACLIHLGC